MDVGPGSSGNVEQSGRSIGEAWRLMGWEVRNGRRYYYRSVRKGRSVGKVYLGCGEAAKQAAQRDAAVKAKRAADQVELSQWQARLAETDRLFADVLHGATLLTEATLLALGFHEHKGEWRLRHDLD